jgi:hypothetical protein
VGAVVVHDDVHVESLRDTRVDQVEELAKLRRSVPLMKLGDHVARLRVKRGEQGRGAVPFIVMRPAFHLSGLQGQQRLGAIECLDLRFLVDAEHRRMRRRVQIQADDVADFLDEERVVRQLERLTPMRLQPTRVPNATDRGMTQADGFGHPARTPVRRAARSGFQRPNDHLLHLLVRDRAFRPGSRLVVEPVQTVLQKPTAPFAHRAGRDMQPPCDDFAVTALGARQNDPRASCHRGRRSRSMGQRLKSLPFLRRQDQRYLWASLSHARLLVREYERAAPFVSLSTVTGH